MEINWKSLENHILFNPRLSSSWKNVLDIKKFPQFSTPHIWLLSSGTKSFKKDSLRFTALSKEALLHSANKVNQDFQISNKDKWLCPLPLFHVGGLSILARSFLSESEFEILPSWSCNRFYEKIQKCHVTSLVPQQVYDLVSSGFKSPASLRVVFVGGGKLSLELKKKALDLGWPLYESYGLTELSSQVATALKPESSDLYVLSHIKSRLREGVLELSSKSLFSAYLHVSSNGDVRLEERKEDWFLTEDRVSLKEGVITVKGRKGRVQKISGELVDLENLEKSIEDILINLKLPLFRSYLRFQVCEQRGYKLELVCEESLKIHEKKIIEEFNKKVMPFERLSEFFYVDKLNKTELGKIREI